MSALLFLLGFGPGPDLARLGADDWRSREAEHARCDNFLFALLLPDRHQDPEINHRLRSIKAKNLKWLDARYIERAVHSRDFSAWVRLYVLEGDSVAYSPAEVFFELHCDDQKADAYFALADPDLPPHLQCWLRGSIAHGEFEQFEAHRRAYRESRAPAPREK
jgi:hypothetical protein